jgi:hypothetical protein
VWILKISSTGDIEWQKTYGGKYADFANALQPTSDGGYVIAGSTASFEFGGSPGSWTPDFWLLKISADGDVELQKTYGGDGFEEAMCVQQTSDGGYIIAGITFNFFTPSRLMDTFIIKVSPTGELGPDCGLIKVRNSDAIVQNTYVSPFDTTATPMVTNGIISIVVPVLSEYELSSETVAWDLHQPPANISLASEMNRGVFMGEKLNTITWEPDPYNSSFNITEYRIYKKRAEDSFRSFVETERVSASTFEYEEHILDISDFEKEFSYAITSVDTDGNESPKSVPVSSSSSDSELDSESTRKTKSESSQDRTSSSDKRIIRKNLGSRLNNSIILKSDNVNPSSINQNQPPTKLSVKREGVYQVVRWERNPLNSELRIQKYSIYRKRAGESDEEYQLIGNVSGNIFAYVDYPPNPDEKYVYALTSTDSEGNESSKSKPIRDEELRNKIKDLGR